MKLKWLSKNFGLHDPDVLDTLELVLPKYKDMLRDNEIKKGVILLRRICNVSS